MNPWHLSPSELMIWGLVAHLIADWPLQNEWMALNKMKRGRDNAPWWYRHPSAYVHASIHATFLCFVFGAWPGVILAYVHLIIDCRWPVVKWSKFIGQTQPKPMVANLTQDSKGVWPPDEVTVLVDIGTEVRFWTDQVFHIVTIAIAALVVGNI